MNKPRTIAVLIAASAVCSEAALAQVEEIVVTAQRREQSIQDTGLTIQAFGTDDLEELRIQSPQDLSSQVTNLDLTSQLGGQNVVVTMRGIGLNDINSNISPSVGTYIDEVFLASPAMLGFSLFDLERVEVLKGPQGTLYGRNTTGGAINFVTKKPGHELEGYLRAGYGNYAAMEAEGAVTVPISEKLSARLAGTYDTRQSYYTNLSRGRLGDINTYALRGTLSADVSPDFETLLTLQYGRDDSSEALWNPVYTFGPNCHTAVTGVPDPANCTDALGYADPTPNDPFSANIGDRPDPSVDVETYSATWRSQWNMGENVSLTSVTGYVSFDRTFTSDQDSSPLRSGESLYADKIEQFSQELRFAGVTGALDWIAGGFYSFDSVESRLVFDFVDLLGFETFTNVAPQDTESFAGFMDGRWQMNDRFTLVAGARLTYEEREFVAASGFVGGPPIAAIDDSIDKKDLSGRLGLEYRPNTDSLYYSTLSKAFRSGGFFGSLALDQSQLEPFGPETNYAFELGGKWSAAEGRLQLNASAFYYWYEDLQANVRLDFGNKLTNMDGTTHVMGMDLDFTVRPIEGLQLRGAIGLLDTELPAFVGPLVGPVARGNELSNAPKFSATGLARYEFPLGSASGLMGALQVDFQYKADTHREVQNLRIQQTPSYTIVNARAAVSSADERWEFAVWGKNLNEEIYAGQIGYLAPFGYAIQSVSAPRTYGATLSYSF